MDSASAGTLLYTHVSAMCENYSSILGKQPPRAAHSSHCCHPFPVQIVPVEDCERRLCAKVWDHHAQGVARDSERNIKLLHCTELGRALCHC